MPARPMMRTTAGLASTARRVQAGTANTPCGLRIHAACGRAATEPAPHRLPRQLALAHPSKTTRGWQSTPAHRINYDIAFIDRTVMNFVNAQMFLALVSEPYVDKVEHITAGIIGALTPSVVATPQQFRPLASPTWWRGAWTRWKALPRRGLLHGAYKYFIDTGKM